MKKLNYLLHSVTVINLVLLLKLSARYRMLTGLAFLSVLGTIPFLYLNQSVIYQKEIHFKVFDQKASSGDSLSLEGLMLRENSSQDFSEVIALVSTYDFTTRLAELLAASKLYGQLSFQHPVQSKSPLNDALLKCKDMNCRITKLRAIVPEFYTLNSDSVTKRFTLRVTTRSAVTTREVLRCFQLTLEAIRTEQASVMVNKQIKQLQELLAKSKADLESKGGFEKLTSGEFMDAMITQHKEKIRTITNRLFRDDNQFSYQRIRLKESNLAAGTDIATKQKLSYENYTKIVKRIEEIRQNIASINSTSVGARTETDGQVLAQLKIELAANEKDLKALGQVNRNVNIDDQFIDTQKGNKSSFEFDYKVSSAHVKKLRQEFEEAKAELDQLYSRKAAMENDLIALKPDLEYVKLLEAKLVSLKFKSSALSSDVSFEHTGSEVSSFKRNSLLKISLFTVLFGVFILFFVFLFIYICDDRIFEELEVQKCIDEIPILGHAPYYD